MVKHTVRKMQFQLIVFCSDQETRMRKHALQFLTFLKYTYERQEDTNINVIGNEIVKIAKYQNK